MLFTFIMSDIFVFSGIVGVAMVATPLSAFKVNMITQNRLIQNDKLVLVEPGFC